MEKQIKSFTKTNAFPSVQKTKAFLKAALDIHAHYISEGISTTNWQASVRETGTSRHHGGPGPPQTSS